MRADSFITSPSCPVRTSPLPLAPPVFMAVASTNRTSPPAPVTARPVATPGVAVRAADSWKNFWRPSASRTTSRSIFTGVLTPARDAFAERGFLAGFFCCSASAAGPSLLALMGLPPFELPEVFSESAVASSAASAVCAEAMRVAVLRSTEASSRSSWRTPASWVYSAMIVRSTSSEISTSPSCRPLRSRCRGHR